jgi:hypothetical protein
MLVRGAPPTLAPGPALIQVPEVRPTLALGAVLMQVREDLPTLALGAVHTLAWEDLATLARAAALTLVRRDAPTVVPGVWGVFRQIVDNEIRSGDRGAPRIGGVVCLNAEMVRGSVGAVITAVVALYGAALSTFNFLRAGPKLRFTVRPGMVVVPSADPSDVCTNRSHQLRDRPTTLRTIDLRYFEKPWSWARLWNRATKAAVLTDPNPAQPLPYELKPGVSGTGSRHRSPSL